MASQTRLDGSQTDFVADDVVPLPVKMATPIKDRVVAPVVTTWDF